MSYDYKIHRGLVFTEHGQCMFAQMQSNAAGIISISGAVKADKLMTSGDTWLMLACMDRLIELGYLREVTGPNSRGQDRVFVAGLKL
jgi:hypothetical protein